MTEQHARSARPSPAKILVVPAIVLAAGLITGFALWEPLHLEEDRHIHRLTSQSAASIRVDLAADVASLLLAETRHARKWSWEEPDQPLSSLEWTLNSRLFLEHYPSQVSMHWADRDFTPRWFMGRDGRPDSHPSPGQVDSELRALLTLAARAGSESALLSPAFQLPHAKKGLGVVVPVAREPGVRLGYFIGVFDVRDTLEWMLSDHVGLGYAITVRDPTGEIYRTSNVPAAASPWTEHLQVSLPGTAWRVEVSPDAAMLQEMDSRLPEMASLLGGLLGSALLSAFFLARSARLRSKELRAARDSLEDRVRQRTTELQRANQDLGAEIAERRRVEGSLRDLSGRLLRLQDEERRRIARELHDSTAQMLGVLAINMDQAERRSRQLDDEKLGHLLRSSVQVIEQVTQDIRTVSYLLHPPILDELGLEYVLPWYVEGFRKRSAIAVELSIQPELGRLPAEVEVALFRIVQEALTNVHRHSGSRDAAIALSRDEGTVTLEIRDHGRGIPGDVLGVSVGNVNLGVGIPGMRERVRQLGGELEIRPEPQGTRLRAVLPLPPRPTVSDAPA